LGIKTLRMTQLGSTNGFSKKLANHAEAISLYFVHASAASMRRAADHANGRVRRWSRPRASPLL